MPFVHVCIMIKEVPPPPPKKKRDGGGGGGGGGEKTGEMTDKDRESTTDITAILTQ